MNCSQLPAPEEWEQISADQIRKWRNHFHSCRTCRRRVLDEAPDQLLFELNEESLPEDFWLGFWDSLEKRLTPHETPHASWFRFARWAAVFAFGVILIFVDHNLPEQPSAKTSKSNPFVSVPETDQYPLIEEVQNPKARLYIFQAAGNEKIVMMFDPDLEL